MKIPPARTLIESLFKIPPQERHFICSRFTSPETSIFWMSVVSMGFGFINASHKKATAAANNITPTTMRHNLSRAIPRQT